MHRRSDLVVVLALVLAATACGSTADTFDAVEPPTTSPGEPIAPGDSTQQADTTVTDDSAPNTDTGATPITGLSPQAVPGLTTAPAETRPPDPVEAFPLDPESARVRAAVDDLAARLDVPTESIDVVRASAVTWGDSSLGCPRPGMQYLQRITDGSLVVLAVDDVEYRYTGGDRLQLCVPANAD